MQIDIASSDKKLYSGIASMVIATAANGEIGFLPGHTPYLAELKPGDVKITTESGGDEVFYISGGVVEVQPKSVVILADVAERAEDLDEARALAAKEKAEQNMANYQDKMDYAAAKAELIRAVAQLKAIQKIKGK